MEDRALTWLDDLRDGGDADVCARGLPTSKLERWKYTKLPAWKDVGANQKLSVKITSENTEIKEINQCFNESFVAKILQAYIPQEQPDMMLWSLNNTSLEDGLFIDIPAGMKLDNPIELVFTGEEGGFYNSRIIVRVGKGAEVTLIERHEGQGTYWKNMVTQIVAEEGAHLTHIRMVDDGAEATHTNTAQISQKAASVYKGFYLTQNVRLARNEIEMRLEGEQAECDLSGVSLLQAQQHGDTTITVAHQVPHCVSRQFFRAVLDDQARGVFQGKVCVHKDAQKTEAYQLSNALLLSEGAEMDTKPELEIYADDVKCSHGATTGQLDDEPLFYLRSRGLNEEQARALLVEAFVNEVVDKLVNDSVKNIVREVLNNPPSHLWEGGQRGEGS